MNREELEKMFDYNFGHDYSDLPDIKELIFDTIIVEVLKSILKEDNKYNQRYVDDFNKGIKQKAKELYNINL